MSEAKRRPSTKKEPTVPILDEEPAVGDQIDSIRFDPMLEEDDTPGPFVISPFTAGKRPRPGQIIAHGL